MIYNATNRTGRARLVVFATAAAVLLPSAIGLTAEAGEPRCGHLACAHAIAGLVGATAYEATGHHTGVVGQGYLSMGPPGNIVQVDDCGGSACVTGPAVDAISPSECRYAVALTVNELESVQSSARVCVGAQM